MINDIKEDNIMFKYPKNGELWLPRLVDFGCFVDVETGDAYVCTYPMPEDAHVYETHPYNGRVECTKRSIVWQIGVLMLYTMHIRVNKGNPCLHLGYDKLGDLTRGNHKERKIELVHARASAIADACFRRRRDESGSRIYERAVRHALSKERDLTTFIEILEEYPSTDHLEAFK